MALPLATPISCTSFRDWLYHKECFATSPELVRRFSGAGPHGLASLRSRPAPAPIARRRRQTVAAFAAAVGFPCPGGYASGLLAASFRQGAGRAVVSTFDLLAHLGSLAVADQLTANLMRYATS